MSKPQLLKELPELVSQGIIDASAAKRIEGYYENKSSSEGNRLMIVFGILGALLVGLGIILIVAHNWDSFPKSIRLVFAFIPLIIGQVATVVLVVRRSESVTWKEGVGTFLVMAVGTSISLVSQIYSIHGDLGKFILIWALLSVPVVYLLGSSIASMLVWVAAVCFVTTTGYFHEGELSSWYFVLLIALALPHFFRLVRNYPSSNFTFFHHWIIPSAVMIALGGLEAGRGGTLNLTYVGLFGVFVIISQLRGVSELRWWINGWAIIGTVGTVVQLLFCSFVQYRDFYAPFQWSTTFIGVAILYIAGLFILLRSVK